jgi:RNA polymerase sigma factor (sigma-70 family)
MATSFPKTVIQHIRRAVLWPDGGALSDGQLLESFIARKDEGAFHALVRRHGPMVLGLCRRILGNIHDADDAFQATFLVLVRKASTVKPREMVGSWLHGVAWNTARNARAMNAKRHRRERPLEAAPEPGHISRDLWQDLRGLLDRELKGLPRKYRLPILLCDLEGKTIKETACQLGWPQGTVAGRLARARALLAKRLTRRGIGLSTGVLAGLIGQRALADVPAALMATTSQAVKAFAGGQAAAGTISGDVVALTQGVLKSMFTIRLKIATAVLIAVAFACCGVGVLMHKATGQTRQADKARAKDREPRPAHVRSDNDSLQGLWMAVSVESGGKRAAALAGEEAAFLVDGNRACWQTKSGTMQGGLYLDPTSHPAAYDFATSEKTIEGIYALDGDTLRLCYDLGEDAKRPRQFSTRRGSQQVLVVLKRKKGVNIHGFRRPDGSKAFPPIIERDEAPQPPPKVSSAPAPQGGKERPDRIAATAPSSSPPARIGNILVRGNTDTPSSLILKTIRLYPGQVLDLQALDAAEKRLAALKQFVVDSKKGIHPTVTVVENEGLFRDVLVTVQEAEPQEKRAERLLAMVPGKKSDLAGLPIKLLLHSREVFVATNSITLEKGGRVKLSPYLAVIFGKGDRSTATVISSDHATLAFDKPISKVPTGFSDLGRHRIVTTLLGGLTEMRIVTIEAPAAN